MTAEVATKLSALRDVKVHRQSGDVGAAVALGNNAAWGCICDRKAPLLASVYAKREVKCPDCRRSYTVEVVVANGKQLAGDVRELPSTRAIGLG